MRYLKFFLREQVKNLILLGIFLAIFLTLFVVSDVPMEVVGYGFILCIAFLVIIYGVAYTRFARNMDELQQAAEEVLVTCEDLPGAMTGKEYVYREMVEQVCAAYHERTEEMYTKEQDEAEYHSLWAHQIKIPISAIRLLLQSRQDGWPEMENQLFSIEQYVQMILNYQRLNSTSNDLVLERQPLDPIVRQVIRKFKKQFIWKKITLEYEGTSMMVLSDEKWLAFVLEQVLSNALKYTPNGSIKVYTEGHKLYIKDTGIGIRPSDVPRIFERGYTGYNGRTDKQATGIGLYLCKQVCDKLGHGIFVESEVNVGTTVCLTLDYHEVDVSW